MCRHVGYIGNQKPLKDALFNKKHSIIEMAYKPKEMQEAKLNADGFGIGWINNNQFYTYKNQYPIWNDTNVFSLCENLHSKLIIGNVRSATITENNGLQNTHPFKYDKFMFSHNGYIANFETKNKVKLIEKIENRFLNLLKGNTDSEYIFFYFCNALNIKKILYWH